MTRPSVVVLDYGSGNLRSAVRAVERAGADVTLTSDLDAAQAADNDRVRVLDIAEILAASLR